MKTPALPFARFGALAFLLLVALPAKAINVNPKTADPPPPPPCPPDCEECKCPPRPAPPPNDGGGNPGSPDCPTCPGDATHTGVGSISFWQRFGRTPLVAEAPIGRMEIYEIGASRLSSGSGILRFNHPLMRRIVDRDVEKNVVTVEEGNGWLVTYRNGRPVGQSTAVLDDLRFEPDGTPVERLADRTLVYYNADNTVDHIVTSAGVRIDWDNAGLDVVWDGNAIGQVWSKADGLMDVTKLSPSSFRLSWYPPAAVGEKENGRWTTTGNPGKTFTFSYSNVGGEHRLSLLEWRNETFHFDYLWKSSDGFDWTLVRDPDGLALSESMQSETGDGNRRVVRTFSDANGVLRRKTEYYKTGLVGTTLVGTGVIGDDGIENRVWSAVRIEDGVAAAHLSSTTNEYGGGTTYTYDEHRRLTSSSRLVNGNLSEVTTYQYPTNFVDGFADLRPSRRLVTRDGVVVSDTAYDYGFAPDGGRLDTVTRSDPVSGVSLVSSRLSYPAASTNAAEAGRIRLSVSEDRTATLYAYSPTANGGYVRTATHGFIPEPDASAPGADASRFAIAPSQSTRTAETVNFRGDIVRVDEFVHTGDGWSPAGWTTYTYNLPHKRTGFADHKGDWEASEWICSGPVWQDLADGTAVTNTFDKAKRLSTSTRYTPFGAVTTAYSYDPLGQVVATTVSTNGVAVRGTIAAYDARGRSVLSVDEQGRTNTVAYAADNRTVTRTTQAGAVTTTTLNTDGSVATVAGNVRPYETRTSGVDPATGLSWTEVRTAQDETSPSVLASRTFRNALGQTVRYETPAPNNHVRATLSAYNALGQLVSEQTDFLSNGTFIAHSALSIAHSYDALGSLSGSTQTSTSGVWRAQSSVSRYALDPDGSVWSRDFSIAACSDPSLAALTNRTDRKLAPLSQSEHSHIVTYDLRGNATHETESFDRVAARGESQIFVPWASEPSRAISLAGRTVEVVDFASVTNRFDYDALGQRIAVTDCLGNATIFSYDSAGHLISTTDPAGFSTSFAYDAAGRRVATTDALGNAVFTDYDAAGRVVAESGATYPVRKGYDAYGRWTSLKTTRDGSTWDETQWTYDEASGVQTAKTYADGSVVRDDYDEEGRPTRTIWARGAWFKNHYDEWGQIVVVSHDDPTIDVAMDYDAFGRLVFSSNNAATYRYAYDDRGLVTNELAIIGGDTNVIFRDFDNYGRLSLLRIADSDYDQTYAYDSAGRLSIVGIPGSTITYAYTPDSLDAGYSVLTPSNTILTRALFRDPQRRSLILSVSNLVNGVDSGSSFDYIYDGLGRPVTRNLDAFGYNERGEVTWARYSTNEVADIYDYDFIGNFTSNRIRSSWSQFTANELNEYEASITHSPLHPSPPSTTELAYDLDGNLLTNGVWSYTFDSLNRLSTVYSNGIVVTENAYDPFYRRVFRRESSGKHEYLYDGWNQIREFISQTPCGTFVENYWGKDVSGSFQSAGGVGGLIVITRQEGSFYPFYDNLGNVRAYSEEAGDVCASYGYDAFGRTAFSSLSTKFDFDFQFATKPFSPETKLYYYGFRFYNVETARWLNRDGLFEKGGWNLYSFNINNCLGRVDILGMADLIPPHEGSNIRLPAMCFSALALPNLTINRNASASSAWEMLAISFNPLKNHISLSGKALDVIKHELNKKLLADEEVGISSEINTFFSQMPCVEKEWSKQIDIKRKLYHFGDKLYKHFTIGLFSSDFWDGSAAFWTVAKAFVSVSGNFTIKSTCSDCCACVTVTGSYHAELSDTFDFVPANNQTSIYNSLATVYSYLAYDILWASKPKVSATWDDTFDYTKCELRKASIIKFRLLPPPNGFY
jgi:RHS repeat-associated protein